MAVAESEKTITVELTTTRNWVYGAKAPDLSQAVEEAIYAAHQYRNKLCELELSKRERHEELLKGLAPRYVDACRAVEAEEALLGQAREEIQRERVRQRTKTPKGVEHLVAAAKDSKERLKQLRANRKATKKAAYDDPAVKDAMDRNAAQHKADQQQAKECSGLYWGTEAIVKQACKSFSSGAPPRFKRFEGTGQLAVQLQKGLDCRVATEEDTRLQLILPPGLEEQLELHGKVPRSQRKAECLIRVGSQGRHPIFARVPIVFHRPLPAGKIKWAYLEKRRIANKSRWSVRFTVESTYGRVGRVGRPSGVVATHVGWLMESRGLRVASALGSDGRYQYLSLSESHLADCETLDKLRSQRKRRLNETRDWLSENKELIPRKLREETSHLHQWKSEQRLAGLAWKWKQLGNVPPRLEDWRKWDKLKWQHECRLGKRIVRRRRNLYRNFAAGLAGSYGIVIIAPIDAKELAEHSDPEELDRDMSARRAKQAAVSDLLRMIREKFHLWCVEVDAAGITKTCANCGEVNEVRGRKVQCSGCCRTYDVDENALLNTLARGEAAIESGALLANENAAVDKAIKKAEKLAKMQAGNRAARKWRRKHNGSNEEE